MPRGGKRSGRPGAQYPNRADLQQGVRAAAGQPYGQRGAQEAAQQAIPLPRQAPPPAPTPTTAAGGGPPPELLRINAPSQRPNEPVTSGVPLGAGPGPEVLAGGNLTGDELRAIYRMYPNEDLRALIEAAG